MSETVMPSETVMSKEEREPIQIGTHTVEPGTQAQIDLPMARLFTGTWLDLPVSVLHSRQPGPTLWLSAALHGDELNGMEIIRLVLQDLDVETLRGTILAVPVVNVFGFINQERYLPDRRDLNRSFPGSKKGSLAGRLAHLFLQEIVEKCDYGIDFHTGSHHRTNLPQIRADLDDLRVRELATAFAAPLMCKTALIRGTLRAEAIKRKMPVLLFEGGEPMRFNPDVIQMGVEGTRRVLDTLNMFPAPENQAPATPSFEGGEMRWLRAGRSGIFRRLVELGDQVEQGDVLGTISHDFFSKKQRNVTAPFSGLILGFSTNPLVNQGDALIHMTRRR